LHSNVGAPMLETDGVAGRVRSLGILPSGDGYLRLSQARLRAIPLIHLISGLDFDPAGTPPGSVGATLAAIVGFTEWASETTPALSLGWDWLMEASDREIRCLRMGEPRSNIMLLDRHSRDLGPMQTAVALALAVDELNWHETVADYVRTRYS
jgi:hypothetical protein